MNKLKKNFIPLFGILFIILFKPVRFFSGKVKRVLSRESQDLIKEFNNKYFNNALPVNIIGSMILTESSDNPLAKGSSGEIGILQVMQSTFNEMSKKYNFNFTFEDCYNKKVGILTGMFVFYDYLKQNNFDMWNTVRSYNVGVSGAKKGKGWEYLQKIWDKL